MSVCGYNYTTRRVNCSTPSQASIGPIFTNKSTALLVSNVVSPPFAIDAKEGVIQIISEGPLYIGYGTSETLAQLHLNGEQLWIPAGITTFGVQNAPDNAHQVFVMKAKDAADYDVVVI